MKGHTNNHSTNKNNRCRALLWLGASATLLCLFATFAGSAAAALPPGCEQSNNTITCTYAFTGGAQTWTVPDGVTSATFDVYGAQGGPDGIWPTLYGGRGGEVKATLAVTAGDNVEILVGGPGAFIGGPGGFSLGGFNGGGAGGTNMNYGDAHPSSSGGG